MNFAIEFVKTEVVTPKQQEDLDALNRECLGDVPTEEVTDNFIAEPFGYLFAMVGEHLISRVALFKREVIFDGQKILLGGMGGVCVTTDHRHHGVASSMIKRAIVILTQEHCDVACLNVHHEQKNYPLYEKLGFKRVSQDPSTMLISLASIDKYNLITSSSTPFLFH